MTEIDNIKSNFKTLENYFIILLASQLFLIITSLFIVSNQSENSSQYLSNNVRIVIMVVTLSAVLILRVYYNVSIIKLRNAESIEKQSSEFYNLNINRMAILETISLINLIAFLITYQFVFLIICGILFILFIIYRPTEKSFNLEMKVKK
jgi:hypothetical protein